MYGLANPEKGNSPAKQVQKVWWVLLRNKGSAKPVSPWNRLPLNQSATEVSRFGFYVSAHVRYVEGPLMRWTLQAFLG
jgi:hypothetical protein